MSKYTTQVRFICETKSGLSDSEGASNVDSVLSKSWNKIFTNKAPFFDEAYRSVLCQKILKHYYLREICCETVGIWELWMNTKLEEILPYYNQLYDSAKIEFNPMRDVDLTRKHNRTQDDTREEKGTSTETNTGTKSVTGNRDTNSTSTGSRNSSSESDGNVKDLYSDTPQGSITGLESRTYLTNARITTDNGTGSTNEQTNSTEKSGTDYDETETNSNDKSGTTNTTDTLNSVEDYLETITGKQGTQSYSSLLNEFRETFLNIDMMVIEEFNDLFFGLW